MNTEVDRIRNWLLTNKLSVHYVDKSQYMLINSNILKSIDSNFELKMGDHVIERTKSYRYLGLLVDEKFSWDTNHISEICWKLSQIAGIILKFRWLLSKKAMQLLYHALVGSKLRYGLICWATASKTLLENPALKNQGYPRKGDLKNIALPGADRFLTMAASAARPSCSQGPVAGGGAA